MFSIASSADEAVSMVSGDDTSSMGSDIGSRWDTEANKRSLQHWATCAHKVMKVQLITTVVLKGWVHEVCSFATAKAEPPTGVSLPAEAPMLTERVVQGLFSVA